MRIIKRLLFIIILLIILGPLCLGVGFGQVAPLPWQNAKEVYGYEEHRLGGQHAPNGGMCEWIGKDWKDNPFRGWPTDFHVDEGWATVSYWWCDPNYSSDPSVIHWGVDIGSYRWTESIYLANAVTTAGVAKVVRMSYEVPPVWNSGMGNFVQIEAYVPRWDDGTPPLSEMRHCTEIPTSTDPFERVLLWERAARADHAAGRLEECWRLSGWRATYMHLEDVAVKTGDVVFYGDVLGRIDSTGNSDGHHLHYQINMPPAKNGWRGAIDPAPSMARSYTDALRFTPKQER